MATVRREHTATLLQNGKVLVAGGFNNAIGEVATAELYDPTTGTWTNTGNLSIARHGHTATLLPNGKVLVAGGYNEVQTLAQAELYDPATGTWTNTGHLNDTRGHHTATLLPNGKLLVAGGYIYTNGQSQYLSSAELYDPASGTWTLTGSLTITRSSHTATLLPNGNVLVAGGRNDDRVLSIAELYDPLSGSWATTGSLSQRRYVHTATLLSTGKVLVAGGHALDVFDGSPPGIASYALKRTELYDPTLGTWTAAGRLTTGREQHTATLLPVGQVLVTGGYSSRDTTLGSAELFDSGGN
jgi:N-acetylneuraminic acid mutarotase